MVAADGIGINALHRAIARLPYFANAKREYAIDVSDRHVAVQRRARRTEHAHTML